MLLPMMDVHRLAQEAGYTLVQDNDESRVLGFVRDGMRVNVYYTTGTVGTCLDHPSKGRTQLFRRNQSLKNLRAIFANPRVHTGAGYYRRTPGAAPREPSCTGKLTGCVASLPCDCALEQLLNAATGDGAVTLALGCHSCYVAVAGDGTPYWTHAADALNSNLWRRLRGKPERVAMDYVALGPGDTYYLAYQDGTTHSRLPRALKEELAGAAGRGGVALLAFAPRGGYFVQYGDGSNTWNGIPASLHNQLSGRMNSMPAGAAAATVEALSIGYGDDDDCWFVRYADGSWRSRGLPAGARDTIARLRSEGHDIASVVLGEEAWAVRY